MNLNIISLIILIGLFSSFAYGCGCGPIVEPSVRAAERSIKSAHEKAEEDIEKYFDDNIKPLLIDIDNIQKAITQTVVHIESLESFTTIDERHLLLLMKKALSKETIESVDDVLETEK